MIEGISSYPKHFLLILLSDVTEMLHKIGRTALSDNLEDSHKVRIFEELLLSKDAALLYLTVNKIMKEGKLTKAQLSDMLNQISMEAEVDLGEYGVGIGYNIPGERGPQHRIKITKDIF